MHTSNTAEIDMECLQLFNELCEQKALLPLAYLLHTWPIPGFTELALHRLRKTLEALSALPDAGLTSTSRELCESLISKLEFYHPYRAAYH